MFELPGARLTLLLSPEPYRGFSAEGGLLTTLTAPSAGSAAARLLEHLAWQPDIDRDRDNPRLKDARRLLQDRAVAPSANGWSITSGNHRHWVTGDPYTCTCLWWAKYHGQRGPCKHVLAVTLYVQAQH